MNRFRFFLPFLALILGVAFVANTLIPPRNPGAFDVVGFGRLPVLANGRIKPIDTIARTSLLQLCNALYNAPSQTTHALVTPDGRRLSPIEWLLDVTFRPDQADGYQTFAIDNPDVLSLFGLAHEDGLEGRRFSFNQLHAKLGELERQAKLAEPVESAQRTPFQRSVLQLLENTMQYQRLRHMFVAPGRDDFLGELLRFQDQVASGVAAVRAKQAGQAHDEAAVKAMTDIGERFVEMANASNVLAIPPNHADDPNGWKSTGAALLETFQTGEVEPTALAYAGLAHAWRLNQPGQFNQLLGLFRTDLQKHFAPQLAKAAAEARFNAAAPFSTAQTLYVAAFFLAVFSWLVWPDALGRSAFWFTAIAWIVATAGIASRMWLEGRPPVTNLYSSALFVGWVAVAFCLGLEYFYRNAIGSVAAGMIGFSTLLIGHYLSLGGDTLEMMRAVLDSNFWLATHVVTVVAGYGATALAGFLALIYIVRGLFTRSSERVNRPMR